MIYSLLVPATSAGTQSIIDMLITYAVIIFAYCSISIAIILIVYHINKKNKKH